MYGTNSIITNRMTNPDSHDAPLAPRERGWG
jgi:hypothetical protein